MPAQKVESHHILQYIHKKRKIALHLGYSRETSNAPNSLLSSQLLVT